jgi:hypothetical protein
MQEEVINIFNVLSRNLNELSHFYFTPKPIIEETSAKVLANQRSLPAIEMEDVTPFNINSSSSQNAPQEVSIFFLSFFLLWLMFFSFSSVLDFLLLLCHFCLPALWVLSLFHLVNPNR